MEDERYIVRRGNYIARQTELRQPEAEAIAHAEQGYSSHGISKEIDVSESTVKDYLQKAMALYGLEITETILPSEEPPDYEKVGVDYLNRLSTAEEKKTWIEYVERKQDKLPRDWANKILNKAEDEGLLDVT